MSRGDATTLSVFIMSQFSICTYDTKRLKTFAKDLLANKSLNLPLNVRQAAERALRW